MYKPYPACLLVLASLLVLAGCNDGEPAAASVASGSAGGGPAGVDSERAAELAARVERLEQRKARVEDANAIKKLQRAYGYYVDAARWDEAADLFAESGTIEIGLDGVYVGRERVREYLRVLGGGRSGLAEGQLNEHMQLMPVVTVAPDGQTAKARWRGLVMAGRHGERAEWGEGPYENEYVKQDGVWKISKLHWFQTFMVPYEGGWIEHEDVNGARHVGDALPPDEPTSFDYEPWPSTFLPPFHFDNPVTGE